MATSFPTSVQALTNVTDNVDYPTAATVNYLNDTVEALEAKVGIDSSAVATSHDYLITNTTGGHDHDGSDSKKVAAANINGFLDEDAMGSDSPTSICSQQSIKAYVDGLLAANKFVVRATPADEDLDDDGNETAWTDWDLTSIVGSTATAVLLRVRAKDDTVDSYMGFRENGESGSTLGLEMTALLIPVAGHSFSQDITVKCDANQVIEYTTQDAGGAAIGEARATVIGWWQPIV